MDSISSKLFSGKPQATSEIDDEFAALQESIKALSEEGVAAEREATDVARTEAVAQEVAKVQPGDLARVKSSGATMYAAHRERMAKARADYHAEAFELETARDRARLALDIERQTEQAALRDKWQARFAEFDRTDPTVLALAECAERRTRAGVEEARLGQILRTMMEG